MESAFTAGSVDWETGDRFLSTSTFIFILFFVNVLLVAGNLWYETILAVLRKVLGKTQLDPLEIFISAVLFTALFVVAVRLIYRKPITIFY